MFNAQLGQTSTGTNNLRADDQSALLLEGQCLRVRVEPPGLPGAELIEHAQHMMLHGVGQLSRLKPLA